MVQALKSPRLPFFLSLLVLLLTLPSLWVGLQFDDYLLERTLLTAPDRTTALNRAFVFLDGNPLQTQAQMETGELPWWTLPEGRVAFWRPLSALTHWLDFRLWELDPFWMHAQNLLWFGLGVWLAARLYREFLPAPLAGLAALLFAVDDAHGYAVGWLSNRNALLALGFGLLTLLAHHRWRTNRIPLWGAAASVSFALGLLSAEAGIAALGYLAAYLLFLDEAPLCRKWITLLPYLGILLAWSGFYRYGGYGGWGTAYLDPAWEPLVYLWAVVERAPVLWLAQLAYPPAELYPFVTGLWLKTVWWGAGLIGMAGFVWLCLPLLKRDRSLRFWLAGAGLSTLPVCASLPANRLLFFIGLGVFPLLAAWLMDGKSSGLKRLAWGLHLGLALLLLPFTAYSPKAFGNIETAVLEAPVRPTVVVISAPSAFHADYFRLLRARAGAEIPERVWYLGAGLAPVSIFRQEAQTLVVTAEAGYLSGFETVFRGDAHPLREGESISLNGLQVTVQALNWEGRPRIVRFEFSQPLESDEIQWLTWENGAFVLWQPPISDQ